MDFSIIVSFSVRLLTEPATVVHTKEGTRRKTEKTFANDRDRYFIVNSIGRVVCSYLL